VAGHVDVVCVKRAPHLFALLLVLHEQPAGVYLDVAELLAALQVADHKARVLQPTRNLTSPAAQCEVHRSLPL
jgi:hypothetical protein